jgi:WD40 repeat protein
VPAFRKLDAVAVLTARLLPAPRTLTGHDGEVWGVAFSPDGRLLATASYDKKARAWDPATGEHLRTLTGHDGWVRRTGRVLGVAFSPDGRLLATASDDKKARAWD